MKKLSKTKKWIIAFFIIVCIGYNVIGLVLNKTKSISDSEVKNKTVALIEQFKVSEARDYLKDVLKKDGKNEEALKNLAYLESYLYDNHEEAIELINKAVKLDDQDIETYKVQGDVYYENGEYDLAIEAYTHIIDLNQDLKDDEWNANLAIVYYHMANCYLEKGDTDKAIKTLELAVKRNPYDIHVNTLLHLLYVQEEHYDLAYLTWKRDNLVELGLGNSTKWDQMYQDVLVNPTHLNLAQLYQTLRLYDEAKLEYEKCDSNTENLNEVKTFIEFRDGLVHYFDNYYKERTIKDESVEPSYRELLPLYSGISRLFDINVGGKTAESQIDIYNKKIEEKYGLVILYGPLSSDPTFQLLAIYNVGEEAIDLSQWGKSQTIHVTLLKNFIDGGRQYWFNKKERANIGGWAVNNEVNSVLDNINVNALELTSMSLNPDIANDLFSQLIGKNSKDLSQEASDYITYNASFHKTFLNQVLENEKCKIEGELSQNQDLKNQLFEEFFEYKYNTTIYHEGQHHIDIKHYGFTQTDLELRAKLSEMAYDDMSSLTLLGRYSPIIDSNTSAHTSSDLKLYKLVVAYIKEHSTDYSQIDTNKNIMNQLTKLNDEDIKQLAIKVYEEEFPGETYE